jgi:hypothetical protein
MILLSSVINQFKDRFFHQYRHTVLPGPRKALMAMAQCRQEHGPHMLAQCSEQQCRQLTYIPHSCGHRNCPHCQSHESQQWIDKQLGKLLPSKYYLITFTLPRQFRELVWRNQKTIYSLMFSVVQDVLKTFTRNDKQLGGTAGFTAILHTQARNLDFHPHIHVVIPAASINLKTLLWRTKSSDYLFSHKALAKVFRAKFLQAACDKKLQQPESCPQKWVVDCKNVGDGDKAIIYLGRYLYRGVIREQDILRCTDTMVTYRYLHAKTGEYRTKTVTGEHFLYLLMLHVLPKGFRRARCYGFLHPCSKRLIMFLQVVLRVPWYKLLSKCQKRPSIKCPKCGAAMKIIMTMLSKPPNGRAPCFA